jgi:hypothetical protein
MSNFNKLFDVIMEDLANSAATAFTAPGHELAGSHAGNFPANVDFFNSGDARWAYGKDEFKIAKPSKPGKRGKRGKSSKKPKITMQRRNLAPSM